MSILPSWKVALEVQIWRCLRTMGAVSLWSCWEEGMVSQGEMESKDLLNHQEKMDHQDPLDLNMEGAFTRGGGRALVLNLKALKCSTQGSLDCWKAKQQSQETLKGLLPVIMLYISIFCLPSSHIFFTLVTPAVRSIYSGTYSRLYMPWQGTSVSVLQKLELINH